MVSRAWTAAVEAFDRDLVRRAVAANTRRAYAIDAGQLAAWASDRRIEPATITLRELRRYLGSLSERRAAPATVARKLAAIRALLRVQVELGSRQENPAELLASPKQPKRLPRVLTEREVTALLDRIPATDPLSLRDRATFELAYASGLRAEELVGLDVDSLDFDGECVRVEGKGGKTRLVPVGEPALRALEHYLSRGRPAPGGSPSPALFLSKSANRLHTSGPRPRLRARPRLAA